MIHLYAVLLPIYAAMETKSKGREFIILVKDVALYSPDPPPFLLGVMLRVWEWDYLRTFINELFSNLNTVAKACLLNAVFS